MLLYHFNFDQIAVPNYHIGLGNFVGLLESTEVLVLLK